jgi:branched-chain amino acid transport system substrate-binding protein
VEGDEVLAIVSSVGTPMNLSVAKYLNSKKVPQILLNASTPKLVDPVHMPWTTTFYASQKVEGQIYARYILQEKADCEDRDSVPE